MKCPNLENGICFKKYVFQVESHVVVTAAAACCVVLERSLSLASRELATTGHKGEAERREMKERHNFTSTSRGQIC